MFIKKLLPLIFIIFFSSCTVPKSSTETLPKIHSTQAMFWQQLAQLCGKSFEGIVIDAPETDTTFRGKKLLIHIRSCEENIIRIPFLVGENRSRTFILKRLENGLEWKHDHRHQDGTSDELTMYGGTTSNGGSATMQIFPADMHTAQILPAAIGNVWWVEVEPGKFLTYNLRRLGTNRLFSIRFDLTKEIATPLAPWGWKD